TRPMDSASGRACCAGAAPRAPRGAVIPLLLDLALAPPDITARLAAEQGAQVALTDAGATALSTGGEASLSARAVGPKSALGLQARGLYGQMWGFSPSSAKAPFALSLSLSADAGASLSPRVYVSLSTQDYLANRFGVRATD